MDCQYLDGNDIVNFLKKDLEGTLNLLFCDANKGKINIKERSAKFVWSEVLGYLHENFMFDRASRVEEKIYEIYSPMRKEICDINADGVGLFLMNLTIGIIPCDLVAKKIKKRRYHNFAVSRIYA